jgi:hypothetical protein
MLLLVVVVEVVVADVLGKRELRWPLGRRNYSTTKREKNGIWPCAVMVHIVRLHGGFNAPCV